MNLPWLRENLELLNHFFKDLGEYVYTDQSSLASSSKSWDLPYLLQY